MSLHHGLVLCSCDMEIGFLSSGLPRWIIEGCKEDADCWNRVHDAESWDQLYVVGSYEFSVSDTQFMRDDLLHALCFPEGGMKCFCQCCGVKITAGEYRTDYAHLLGLRALSNDLELARHHLQYLDLMEEQGHSGAVHRGNVPVFSEEGGNADECRDNQVIETDDWQCILPKESSVQMLREAPLLRAMMVSTQTTVAARVIAEESKMDDGLNQILMSRVNRVEVDSGDAVCSGAGTRVQREMNSAEEPEDVFSQEGLMMRIRTCCWKS